MLAGRPAALAAVVTALAILAAACSGQPGSNSGGEAETAGAAGQTGEVIDDGSLSGTEADDGSSGAADSAQPADQADAPDPVATVLAAMTVEDKIGQLLMPAVFGTGSELSDAQRRQNLQAHGYATPEEIVEAYRLGGVIYLEANVGSAPELTSFSRSLQSTAMASTGLGLLVAVDQEGGRVSRISDEVTQYPPAADMAGDARRVRESSYITGQQVQQQGINVVLAPVADIVEPGQAAFIGNRSFGADPALVASMVVAAVDGLQQSGVAAAVKHWPGHGATAVDSHSRLPTVNVDREVWERRERVPFAAAIEQDVAIVLVGHLAMPQLDPSAEPATISPVLINELLREELGFDGVVMSDALNMGAVSGVAPGELAVASVLAGIDVILIPPSLTDAAAGLLSAVEDGRISAEVLDAAVARVLRLKLDLGLFPVT
jgi:beta-N-acetylhexosaminidase